jgi:hypothetical protein
MYKRMGGPQSLSAYCGEEKNLFPLPEIESRLLVGPAHNLNAIPSELSREKPTVVQLLMNSQNFMQPEGSLPYSQESFTEPYLESRQSSPHHPTRMSLRSISILFTHVLVVLLAFLPISYVYIYIYIYIYMRSTSPHSCYMFCPSHPSLLIYATYLLEQEARFIFHIF